MPEENWWPRDDMWNKHYFGQNAFNAAPERYDASIAKGFGKPEGIEDYCRKAQLINIESNKAMYVGRCIGHHDLDGSVGISFNGLADI